MTLRRGRPSIVRKNGDNFVVTVQGNGYTFKQTTKGLVPTGETRLASKNDDYDYARELVKRAIAEGTARDETSQE